MAYNKTITAEQRESLARKGSLIGIAGNAVLGFLKLFIGFVTGSLAITADGVDTVTDIFTSFLTLIATKLSSKPADESHPYGHEKIEPIITKILSLIVIYAGYEVLSSAISRLGAKQSEIKDVSLILVVSAISVFTKFFLYRYKLSIGKKINSSSFIADALNMRNDVFTSISVLAGVFLIFITGIWWIDALLAMFVSVFIFKVGISLFMESSNELMDGSKELGDVYNDILKGMESFCQVKNPHRIRVRKSGYVYFVEMHIEIDPQMTVHQAHMIVKNIENEIKKENPYIRDVIIHIEPLDNEEKEDFGFNVRSIKKTFGKKGNNGGK